MGEAVQAKEAVVSTDCENFEPGVEEKQNGETKNNHSDIETIYVKAHCKLVGKGVMVQ